MECKSGRSGGNAAGVRWGAEACGWLWGWVAVAAPTQKSFIGIYTAQANPPAPAHDRDPPPPLPLHIPFRHASLLGGMEGEYREIER